MKRWAPSRLGFTVLALHLGATPACDSEPGDADSPAAPSGGDGASPSSSPGSGGTPNASTSDAGGSNAGATESGGSSAEATGGSTAQKPGEDPDKAKLDDSASGGAASGGAASGGGDSGTEDSTAALEALRTWLEGEASARSSLESEPFAALPLSRLDAEAAQTLLWEDRAAQIRDSRQAEVDDKSISLDGVTLDYETVLLGEEPEGGRSLFISMHGGGDAPKETNDEQWQNQIVLAESYAPQNALWIAPRAPTDDWNMWFKDHIVPLFDRLITNMIVFEGINPNKVYLTGYSAGGDGVYQLGPTIADRWAAAAMSAGHPNDMTPINLRNIGFAIHVGGDDTAFDRNLVAAEWGQKLGDLQLDDPQGYDHQVEVHEGLPHWMNLADQPSIPYIQGFERNPFPEKVVWMQSTLLQDHFYWLELAQADAVKNAQVVASIEGQTIQIESEDLSSLSLHLSDEMLDLDQPVKVEFNGAVVAEAIVPRSIAALNASLAQREDPKMIYSATLMVSSE